MYVEAVVNREHHLQAVVVPVLFGCIRPAQGQSETSSIIPSPTCISISLTSSRSFPPAYTQTATTPCYKKTLSTKCSVAFQVGLDPGTEKRAFEESLVKSK